LADGIGNGERGVYGGWTLKPWRMVSKIFVVCNRVFIVKEIVLGGFLVYVKSLRLVEVGAFSMYVKNLHCVLYLAKGVLVIQYVCGVFGVVVSEGSLVFVKSSKKSRPVCPTYAMPQSGQVSL
jgi:hypothetical protein